MVEAPVMARKAYSYIRFSGKRQEAGHSYRRQEEMAAKAAQDEGIPLDTTLSLADKGIPAFRGQNWKRGNLGKFLDLVDAGIIAKGSMLIIERVNRLSRLPWMEQVELWKELLRRGIIIRTCEPPSRYTQENMNDLSTGCPVVIFMMLAHQESKQKSEWLSAVWGAKKRAAREDKVPNGRKCPGWLEPVTEVHPKDPNRVRTLGYRVRKERAEVVRWIFEQALNGLGANEITHLLHERKVPVFKRAPWSPGLVRCILTNRAVFGEYQESRRLPDGRWHPSGPRIPGYYPAILEEEVFNSVQAARRARRRKGGRPGPSQANLFTHLLFDEQTGNTLHCGTQKKKGIVYRYLCNSQGKALVAYHHLEDPILDTIAQLTAKDVDGRHKADQLTERVDTLQAERCRLGHELDSLDEQIRELRPEKWPKRVVARMAELEELIKAKDDELRAAKEAANTSGRTEILTDVKTLRNLLKEVKGTKEEMAVRNRIKLRLRLLVESIWIRLQVIDRRKRYIHGQLYLHGGERRYFRVKLGLGDFRGVKPWDLEEIDFRAKWARR